jgi:HD-like signal output (HDOD) protein
MSLELQSVINTVGDLPPMPVVAVKVIQLLQDPKTSSVELAEAISRDQAVSARVLKIANSSFYSLKRQVKTLEHAIAILGEKTLKSLVLAASLKGLNKSFGLMEKMLWEDSIGGATGARMIALYLQSADPEEAFLAGLFRHIGRMVMNNLDPVRFRQVMEEAYNGESRLEELERRHFPFSHAVIGAAVMEKWNFSETLSRTVRHHEDMGISAGEDPHLYRLTALVNLADHLCRRLGIGQSRPEEELDVTQSPGAKALGIEAEPARLFLEEFRTVFEKDRDFFLA